MLTRSERILDNIPSGPLGIIAIDGCQDMGNRVNDYLVKWRNEGDNPFINDIEVPGYQKDSYLINAKVPRFGSGEAKALIVGLVLLTSLLLSEACCLSAK